MQDSLKDLTKRNILFPAILKIVSFSASAIIVWLLGKKLKVEEYGVYNLFQGVLLYFTIFSSLGLPLLFYRFFPEFHEKGAFNLMRKTLISGMLLRGAVIIILFAVLIIIFPFFGSIFKISEYKNLFLAWGIGILLSLEIDLYILTFTSLFLHRTYTVVFALYSVIRGCSIAYFLKLGRGLNGVILSEIVALAIQFVMLTGFLAKKFPKGPAQKRAGEYSFKRLFKYAIYSYLQDIGDLFFYINTDFFVISYFLGNTSTGLYAMGANLALMISRWFPIELFHDLIRPLFFKRFAREPKNETLEEMFSALVKTSLFVAFPVFVSVLVLGKPFLQIFFPKYTSVYPVFATVCFFTLFRGPRTILEMVVYAKERLSITLFSKLFSLYNLFADIVFVCEFGIIGAAIASGTSEFLRFLYIFVNIRKDFPLSLPFRSLFRIFVNSALLAVFLMLLRPAAKNYLLFVGISFLSVPVYLLFSYLNRVFTSAESEFINSVTGRRWFIF